MNAVRQFFKDLIQRHPVATYFVLAYTVTWTCITLVVGPQNIMAGTISTPQFLLIWAAMLLGSGGVGVLLAGVLEGQAGLREMAAGMRRWRVGWRWYLPLLIVPLVASAVLAVLSQVSPAFMPGILTASDKVVPLVSCPHHMSLPSHPEPAAGNADARQLQPGAVCPGAGGHVERRGRDV